MTRVNKRQRIGMIFIAASLSVGLGYFYAARNAESLLTQAADRGHALASSVLLRLGADARYDDDAPLRWAATRGHTDIVRMLLDCGADIHAQGDFALRWAAFNGHTDTVRLLFARGAGGVDVDYRQLIDTVAHNGHKETLDLLMRHVRDRGMKVEAPVFSPHGRPLRNWSVRV